ncbi:MAG: penicillin-binding protein activator [bacterium]
MKKVYTGLYVFVFLLSSLFTHQDVRAQGGTVRVAAKSEKAFKSALTRYVGKDYRAALAGFKSLANSETLHHRMTATLLMTGKSLYHLGRYAEALPYYDRLISTFPQSKYLDDAYYARASANYRLNRRNDAVKDLLWLVDKSSERRLAIKGRKLANQIMRADLSSSELRRLLRYAKGDGSSALVTSALARQQILNGATDDAVSLLNRYKRRHGASAHTAQIDQLLTEAKSMVNRPVKVGVILPLSGYYSEEGLGVLRGVRFAHSHATNGSQSPIQLVIRDSESSLIKALHHVNTLIHREHVRVLIGELESSVTAGIGALAAVDEVPLLAPAASENGVASVGMSIFQLNSDLERKGRAIAEYAVKELGMATFATLAPADEYGQQMVDSFTSTVDRLGGRIIAQGWYYGTPEDLSRQFKNIRESAFHHDSTDVIELIREAEEQGDRLDEDDIPVLSIDGFFVPVYSEDLKYVAPQLALNNIRSQILGGEYLDDIDVLKDPQVERYINGAIFVSDYFPDESNMDFRRFRTDFRLKMKRTPERWEVFGYDAYQIIRQTVQTGARTGLEIKTKLNELDNYTGTKGNVSFLGNNRVNQAVNILQFINGRIIKHQN